MVFREGDSRNDLYPHMRDYTSFLKKMERSLVGRETEMRQLQAAMCRPELCNVILLAEAGSGKGHTLDTIIPVSDSRGYITFGEIKVGDEVFDENGQPAKVIGVYPQGKKHLYSVKFTDGTSVICNAEHLWAARTRWRHYNNSPFEVHTLEDMMNYGITRHVDRKSKPYDVKSWYVPCNRAVQRPDKDLPIHPYALGVFIGDGCLTDRLLSVSSNDEAVIRRVGSLIGAKDVESHKGSYSWHFLKTERRGVRDVSFFHTSEMADLLLDSKVFGYKSVERRIPRDYMLASIDQRMELLRGLMDTDGTATGSGGRVNVSFATNSKGLADDVRELAASLGFRTSLHIQKREDDIHTNVEYGIYFKIDDDTAESLFWLQRHKDKIRANRRNDKKYNRIFEDIAIEEVVDLQREDDIVCIYVDCPSHLYQVGKEHIVTHNTALVQGTMANDPDKAYLEVDLPKMISNLKNENEMADKLKQLFGEVERFRKAEGKEIVLFIDEFHQIVQLSPAAVEVLKPLLADSGTRGIIVIAATTYIEFQQYIASNLPLVERLQRINLSQPNKEVTVSILRDMAVRYDVASQFKTDAMFEAIYEYTNRYIPANAQPRKSILMLDSMIGWHRCTKRPIDMNMLADVIYETEGINIAFRVDATKIKQELDKRVLSQDFATSSIENRLQICCADLNNKSRPMSSFLFTGSTGVGKSLICSTTMPMWNPTESSVSWKKAGDVVPGDYIFDREGKPTKVLGVFPQGKREVYRVTLGDGRYLDVSDNHLWAVFPAKRARDEGYTIYSTQTLLNKGLETKHHDRVGMKYFIPMNQPVQWVERNYKVQPYVVGAMIADGLLTAKDNLLISSDDEFVIKKVADMIGAASYKQDKSSYSWCFYTGESYGDSKGRRVQLKDVCGDLPEIYNKKSPERRIPEAYMTGSVSQRWELIQGLFDCDGSIGQADGGRYNVTYSTHSEMLAYDVQKVLYSLGVSSSVNCYDREPDEDGNIKREWRVHVMSKNEDKYKFFSLPRKLDIAKRSVSVNKQREKTFDYVGIRSIEKLGYEEEMVCFYVDNDEHLYQAGDFVVTHNTEVSKQLANILFQDERALIRMDMTEYALPESLERFRQELTTNVWTRPYCIILLDEIEKACAPITRLLLQVLDDGRLLDRNNREVTFKNAYIIITTNAGSEIYKTISQYGADDSGSGKLVDKYEKLIKDSIGGTTGGGKFPPELLGRIDCLVPFQPLSENTMMDICRMKLNKLRDEVRKKHHMEMNYENRVVDYIVKNKMSTDSDAGGARAIVSRIEREVTVAVAKFINANPNYGKPIYVCVEGSLASEHKDQLETDAKIIVAKAPPVKRQPM